MAKDLQACKDAQLKGEELFLTNETRNPRPYVKT